MWKYHVVTYMKNFTDADLNEKGAQGWELVSVVKLEGAAWVMVFKKHE